MSKSFFVCSFVLTCLLGRGPGAQDGYFEILHGWLQPDVQDEIIGIQQEHIAMTTSNESVGLGLEKKAIRVAETRLLWIPVA
jgi:hypothetical protein